MSSLHSIFLTNLALSCGATMKSQNHFSRKHIFQNIYCEEIPKADNPETALARNLLFIYYFPETKAQDG